MEPKFELISQSDNTVSYDIGDGLKPAFSAFYAAGYPDSNGDDSGLVAVEHRTLEYFGTRVFPVAAISVNGVTFTTVTTAVKAINALDFTVPVTDQIGNLASHTDIKSLDQPTVTMPDPVNESQTITKTLATRGEIPVVPQQPRQDITAMFGITPAVVSAQVVLEDFGEGTSSHIEIFASNEGPGADDLVIEAPFGFGSLYAYTANNADGNRTLPLIGVDGIVHYGTITPETYSEDGTPVAKSIITIPTAVTNFTIKYPRGASLETDSYFIDINGVVYPFSAADTPLSNMTGIGEPDSSVLIGGISVVKRNVASISFGDDYNDITILPPFFMYAFYRYGIKINLRGFKNVSTFSRNVLTATGVTSIDLSMMSSLTTVEGTIFRNSDFLVDIQIGSIDWSLINVNADVIFNHQSSMRGIIRANTQAIADIFVTKFAPIFDNWTVIINEPTV